MRFTGEGRYGALEGGLRCSCWPGSASMTFDGCRVVSCTAKAAAEQVALIWLQYIGLSFLHDT